MELEAAALTTRPRPARRCRTSWSPTIRPTALGNPYLSATSSAARPSSRRIQRALDDASRAPPAAPVRGRARRDPPGRPVRHRPDVLRAARRRGTTQLDEMGDTTATFEWAFRWLDANRPPASPNRAGARRLPDGQPDHRHRGAPSRPELAAVLDWELTHTGEAVRGSGLVLHQGVAVRRTARARRGWARQHRGLPRAPTKRRRRHVRRPDRDALVAGAVHAALGRHLPLPGRAPPVRPDAVGRTGRDRPSGLRNRVRPAHSLGARHDRPAQPAHRGRTGRGRRRVPRDRRPRRHQGAVNFHARVAANVLRTVERELLDDTAANRARRWPPSASPTSGELSAAIRRGELDDRGPDVLPIAADARAPPARRRAPRLRA